MEARGAVSSGEQLAGRDITSNAGKWKKEEAGETE